MHQLPEAVAAMSLFLGLPWLIFHYVTRWRTAATLTTGDERTIEELYDLARRLGDRVKTIERIVTAENPNWRDIASDAPPPAVEDRNETYRRVQ